jgi:hypothetical protein
MSISSNPLNIPLEKLKTGDFCYFSYGDIYEIEEIKELNPIGNGFCNTFRIKFKGIEGTGDYVNENGEVSGSTIKKLYRDILKTEKLV